MPDPQPQCDVLVVGAGPAGCTAARLLSLWGFRVVVATKPPGDDPELPESLTPSCQKFFDLLGISPAIDAAGFVRSGGHTVWWGAPEARVEPFAGGARGWQVSSGRLSAAMLAEAVRAGAVVHPAALSADQALVWPATYLIDSSGRAGVLARHAGRRSEPGHRTVALIGTWRRTGPWPVEDWTHTLLESYEDGWAWSIPLNATDRSVAVMVDPKTTALAKGDGAEATYRSEIAKTHHLARVVAGAQLLSRPGGWDASMYSAERTSGDRWLLVGDAASFVDPLSSAGVRKAMASGWLAAAALHTSLKHPELQRTAFAFAAARETQTYQQFLALTRRHLRAGQPGDHPFWRDRAAAEPAVSSADREAIERAFAQISQAHELRLVANPALHFAPRPALTDREVVLERRLVSSDGDEGVRYLHGVDVLALLDAVPGCRQVPEAYARYTAHAGPVEWPEFLTALATAVARRWLVGI